MNLTNIDSSDEILISKCANGDQEALRLIAHRYREKVYQFVVWLTEPQCAEDLTQDVFVEVYRSAGSFRHKSSFRTWLYSIAKNVCRGYQRSQRYRLSSSIEALDEPLLDDNSDPYNSVVHSEAHQALRRALEQLTLDQRVTLLLKEWEDLSYIEIAEVLEVRVGTVRSRLHTARAMLAERLARYRDRST